MISPETAGPIIVAAIGFVAQVKKIILDAHERQRNQDGKVSLVDGGEVSLVAARSEERKEQG